MPIGMKLEHFCMNVHTCTCIRSILFFTINNYYMLWWKDVLKISLHGCFKNRWTKQRFACTHFNAFSMLILNYDQIIHQFLSFEESHEEKITLSHLIDPENRIGSCGMIDRRRRNVFNGNLAMSSPSINIRPVSWIA